MFIPLVPGPAPLPSIANSAPLIPSNMLSSTSAPTLTADIVPAPEAGILYGPAETRAQPQQEAPLVVHPQHTDTESQGGDASRNVFPPNGVVPQVHPSPTHPSDLLNDIHQGPWLEIHRNFVSYVLHTLELYDGSSSDIVQLSKQWAEWDSLTSLANYRFVVQILFGYLTESSNLSCASAIHVSNRLSEDVSCVLRQLKSIFSDRTTYQHFLSCRGAVAQQLLDLLQDVRPFSLHGSTMLTKPHQLLDSFHESTSRALLSKALLRLSGKCELHPTCFTLTGLEKMGRQVAGGGFGDIWKGSVGGQTVAIKSMRQFKDDDVKASMKKLGREALIWRQLSHPNLLPFFGLYILDDRLCLISPWMDNGDLKEFLNSAPSDIDRISLMMDVARGLEYLHSQGVVHGDLKTVNILVTPSHRACITDFGLSTIVDDLSLKMTFSSRGDRAGTVRYQAPELLKNERSNHYGSDIYAFGCVSYEILTGKVPFFELANEVAIIFKVVVGIRPSRLRVVSPDLWLLLDDCWHQQVDKRPTTSTILQRLSGQLVGGDTNQSPPDWDDAYSARFRRSLQEWPLFPSTDEIERRIPLNAINIRYTGSDKTAAPVENLEMARSKVDMNDRRRSLHPIRRLPPLPSSSERVRFKADDFASAVKICTENIKRDPNDPRGYNNRAAAYMKLGIFPLALKDVNEAIKTDPTFGKLLGYFFNGIPDPSDCLARAYIRKSSILFAMRDYSKAIQAAQEAMDHDPEHKHVQEIREQKMKCNQALFRKRIVETQERTLRERVMQEQAQTDLRILQDYMKDFVVC
ncbi:Protein kinase domain-containing protein [Mycena sanguinolenta]|uniref:Protein kinase domain-containing protein n=1 Tax=Mycena sanguinolenta TaxID=230812 RepID=A0A8H6Y9J4_9AGAR|nr:Protein kinase domain-containing protein [Mycena sanguinolenta]